MRHKKTNVRGVEHGSGCAKDARCADVSAELRRSGIPHSPAQYDADGNCLTCGEGRRCPGVHTFEEIQAAGRARS